MIVTHSKRILKVSDLTSYHNDIHLTEKPQVFRAKSYVSSNFQTWFSKILVFVDIFTSIDLRINSNTQIYALNRPCVIKIHRNLFFLGKRHGVHFTTPVHFTTTSPNDFKRFFSYDFVYILLKNLYLFYKIFNIFHVFYKVVKHLETRVFAEHCTSLSLKVKELSVEFVLIRLICLIVKTHAKTLIDKSFYQLPKGKIWYFHDL